METAEEAQQHPCTQTTQKRKTTRGSANLKKPNQTPLQVDCVIEVVTRLSRVEIF